VTCEHEGERRAWTDYQRLEELWAAHVYIVGELHARAIFISEDLGEAAEAAAWETERICCEVDEIDFEECEMDLEDEGEAA